MDKMRSCFTFEKLTLIGVKVFICEVKNKWGNTHECTKLSGWLARAQIYFLQNDLRTHIFIVFIFHDVGYYKTWQTWQEWGLLEEAMVWAESRTAQPQGSKTELQCSVEGLIEMF